jgi:hypothetical protein
VFVGNKSSVPAANANSLESQDMPTDSTTPSVVIGIEDNDSDFFTPSPSIKVQGSPSFMSPPRKCRKHTSIIDDDDMSIFIAAKRAIERIDLNTDATEEENMCSQIVKRILHPGQMPPSPWDMCVGNVSLDFIDASSFLQWAKNNAHDDDRLICRTSIISFICTSKKS